MLHFSMQRKRNKPVLDNINLKINSGETIGIIGGTGSSKSSLVQLIPRLYDVTSGEVKVGGVDVRDYGLETLRDSVAWYFRKMYYSQVPLRRICAGVMRKQRMKN